MEESNKENDADAQLIKLSPSRIPRLSPTRATKKARSKSIGPEGLGGPLREADLNRRKSVAASLVKSILSSGENDAKQKLERRKSLANRRVSFAPEATLHTWDVIEYLRENTTSTFASSNPTVRAQQTGEQPQSQPLIQLADGHHDSTVAEDDTFRLFPPTLARRSSLPQHSLNQAVTDNEAESPDSSPFRKLNDDEVLAQHLETGAVFDEVVAISASAIRVEKRNASSSSEELENALRQAAAHAGIQSIAADDDEDMTMDIADDETTSAFRNWARPVYFNHEAVVAMPEVAYDQNETVGVTSGMKPIRPIELLIFEDEMENDETMDEAMDFTAVVGGIAGHMDPSPVLQDNSPSTKRVFSEVNDDLHAADDDEASRKRSRRLSRYSTVSSYSTIDEAAMDLTVANGIMKAINPSQVHVAAVEDETFSSEELTMDLTLPVGNIITSSAPADRTHQEANPATPMASPRREDIGTKLSPQRCVACSPLAAQFSQASPRNFAYAKRNSSSTRLSLSSAQMISTLNPEGRPAGAGFQDGGSTITSPRRSPRESPVKDKQQASKSLSPRRQSRDSQGLLPAFNEVKQASPQSSPTQAHVAKGRKLELIDERADTEAPDTATSTSAAAKLSSSMKLLSTPRKQAAERVNVSPVKLEEGGHTSIRTAIKSPKVSFSPAIFRSASRSPEKSNRKHSDDDLQPAQGIMKLRDFLQSTSIRFMDLSTTKRRQTGIPTILPEHLDDGTSEGDLKLENYVSAGACTVPMLELYQHSCHELKRYISEGKQLIRTLENTTLQDISPEVRGYLAADQKKKKVIDNQFKAAKTSARLHSRMMWYEWRSNLLDDLQRGLARIEEGFRNDDSKLGTKEVQLQTLHSELRSRHEQLLQETEGLERRRREIDEADPAEAAAADEVLAFIQAQVTEKEQKVAYLKKEKEEKAIQLKNLSERQHEVNQVLRDAQVRHDECRGWTAKEVSSLKGKLDSVQAKTGWSMPSASADELVFIYRSELEVRIKMARPTAASAPPTCASIQIAHASAKTHPPTQPLTKCRQLFLNLLRAHLDKASNRNFAVSAVLELVKQTWDACSLVLGEIRQVETSFIVEQRMMSENKLALITNVVLPTHPAPSKVRVVFELTVSIGDNSLQQTVLASAETIYGRSFSQPLLNVDMTSKTKLCHQGDYDWLSTLLRLQERLLVSV